MKIVIAPDSFKGSLSAIEVCDIVEGAILKIMPTAEIIKIPISDGGEGLVEVLVRYRSGELIKIKTKDPLSKEITAAYGILDGGVAVIEMSAASGLPLLAAGERNPLKTSTYGTGEMIVDAINRGCRKIILGLGGSATNDGGLGVANALGIRFYDQDMELLAPCGENLSRVMDIDTSQVESLLQGVEIIIACDVENVLCGVQGAAAIYGPQKGADSEMVALLDQGLQDFGRLLEKKATMNLVELKGIGAAGGMALPLVALFKAQLKSGLDIVLDEIGFDSAISGADMIITGEGKTDAQSVMGKVISGVGNRGKNQNIPVVVVSGALDDGYEAIYNYGVVAAFAIFSNDRGLEWHMQNAPQLLEKIIYNLFRFQSIICKIPPNMR
ncbi:glycerate kinase [Acetobacterium sp.]|jgi:glycerate kinase|uniref:glycerate kinase n=1 Tax=Acetobacterium sp. TaxID=1872094 RepID=UPI000CAF81C3|nr:glycerate kinase [Acetobacterium sp.]MDO9491206.1 glycerate kinase [Acetobacterium sp.]PKM72251.1 MAG: glycerate kinase [Firmicutes bacterium HGW-Firmicutes-17]